MRKAHIAFHPTEGVQSNGSFHIQKLPSASLLSPFKRGDSSTQPLSSLSASHTRSSLSTHSKSFENTNRVGVGVAVAIAVGFGVALAVGVGVAVTFGVVRVVVAVAVGVGVAPLLFTKRFLEPKLCAKNGFSHVTVTVLQCKRKHKKRQEDACIGDALALCYRTNFFHSFASESSKMVLEATMICIDNSEWMRNGDSSPSRFQAQADAVNLICGAKTQSNPENTVGVLTMAGKGVRVLVTPTSYLGKILACMHGLGIGGEMNLAAGIQVAQLALKHRQNKKATAEDYCLCWKPCQA